VQFPENLREIDPALPDADFLSEIFWISWIEAVFRMQAAHILADNVQRAHWITLAVKNKIGGIEIRTDVVEPGVQDSSQHSDRRFLSSLHQEYLPVGLAVARHFTNGLHTVGVQRCIGIFRNKAAVRVNGFDVAPFSQVGGPLQSVYAGSPRLQRYEANG